MSWDIPDPSWKKYGIGEDDDYYEEDDCEDADFLDTEDIWR